MTDFEAIDIDMAILISRKIRRTEKFCTFHSVPKYVSSLLPFHDFSELVKTSQFGHVQAFNPLIIIVLGDHGHYVNL